MERQRLARRGFLAGVGVTATAGCLSSLPSQSEEGVRLGTIALTRHGGDEHPSVDVTERVLEGEADDVPENGRTYPLRVLREGNRVFDQAITLAPREYVQIHPTWSTESATYTVLYASESHVDKIELSAERDGVDPAQCLYIAMIMDLFPDRSTPHTITVIDDDHPWMDGGAIEWTC